MNPGTGVEGARVCTRLLRRDQGSLPLFSLGSGQRSGGRSVPGDGGASCRSGLGSEKGSSPVCLLGARWVGMWTAARSGSGLRPRPALPFTGTCPRTDDASSPAARFSDLDAWWGGVWGWLMPTLLTHCSVMGHGSVKAEGQADLGSFLSLAPGPQACSFHGHVATETQ